MSTKPVPTNDDLDRKMMSVLTTLDGLGAVWILGSLAAAPPILVGLYRWAF